MTMNSTNRQTATITTTAAATPGGPHIDTTTITAGLAGSLATLAVATGGPWGLLALAVVTALAIHHTPTR
jgi:hypothetical protein